MTDVAIPAAPTRTEAEAPAAHRSLEIPTSRSCRAVGLILVAIALVCADRRDRGQQAVAARVPARRRRRRVDDHRPVPRLGARPDHGSDVGPGADRVHDPADAEDGADHADGRDADPRGRLAARRQTGNEPRRCTRITAGSSRAMIVVGVMAVIALGLLEPANIAVLIELKKPRPNPAGDRAADEALHLLRRDPRGHADRDARDHDQAGVGMNEQRRSAGHAARDGVAGADRRRRHLPVRPPPEPRPAGPGGRAARRVGARCSAINMLLALAGEATSPGSGSSRSPSGRCSPMR